MSSMFYLFVLLFGLYGVLTGTKIGVINIVLGAIGLILKAKEREGDGS